ncbi:MAG: hypothetical protein N2049_02270 [Anaerolineales bacterium]|nr:hypothetical protein [Anaerolineales bacterium]MCX7608032.1 hypothetical protein [Anaerolineales bacterium]MDW8227502.1 hypothetical protein [Anaerolineales bacterium]
MNEPLKSSLLKPTVQTPFHIDFSWWSSMDANWRVDLYDMLCPEHQALFATSASQDQQIDWVDPETAEVSSMDALQMTLSAHCARQPGFVNSRTTLVEAVFRLLLANGNRPMTVEEMSRALNRPADIILKTLSGPRVYKGVRPMRL